MVAIKTQTKRSTKYITNLINVNLFCEHENFQIGIVTSKYWGDFSFREGEDTLITIHTEDIDYEIGLKEFIKKLKPILKNKGKRC